MTIGVGIGIGVGNISHYRKFNKSFTKYFIQFSFFLGYFSPTNMTYYGNISNFNITLVRDLSGQINSNQSPPLDERLQNRESVRKSREFWLSMNKP